METTKQDLLTKLELIKSVASPYTKDPVVYSTGERLGVITNVCSLSLPFQSDLPFALSGNDLHKLVKDLENDSLELSTKKGKIVIKSDGKIKTRASLVQMDDHADVMESLNSLGADSKEWKLAPKDFCDGIKQCMSTMSNSPGDGFLYCAHVTNDRIISSDALRISEYVMEDGLGDGIVFEMPRHTLKGVIEFNPTSVDVQQERLVFLNESGGILSVRRFEAPLVEKVFRVLDTKFPEEVHLPKQVREIIKDVVVLADDNQEVGRKVVELRFRNGEVSCKSASSRGWVEKSVDSDYSGREMVLRVIPEFVAHLITPDGLRLLVNETDHMAALKSGSYKQVMIIASE